MTSSAIRRRPPLLIGSVLMIAAAAAALTAAPGIGHAEEPRSATRLQIKPQPPTPAKEVFVRSKPHVNVGPQQQGMSKLKLRPGRPTGPGNLTGELPELADWYCGEGAGPGGYAQCTDELAASCNGTYKPPGTNGPEQTWGMCHEKS